MVVVSNASPILNLAILGRLDLLQQQFTEVVIPRIVQAELLPTPEAPGALSIRDALAAGWLKGLEGGDAHLFQVLQLDLDRGEAATIALAVELKAELVLMDERDGRKKAHVLGLQPIGVIGVLLRAKRQGQIDSLAEALRRLQDEAGFYLEADLVTLALASAGEGSA